MICWPVQPFARPLSLNAIGGSISPAFIFSLICVIPSPSNLSFGAQPRAEPKKGGSLIQKGGSKIIEPG